MIDPRRLAGVHDGGGGQPCSEQEAFARRSEPRPRSHAAPRDAQQDRQRERAQVVIAGRPSRCRDVDPQPRVLIRPTGGDDRVAAQGEHRAGEQAPPGRRSGKERDDQEQEAQDPGRVRRTRAPQRAEDEAHRAEAEQMHEHGEDLSRSREARDELHEEVRLVGRPGAPSNRLQQGVERGDDDRQRGEGQDDPRPAGRAGQEQEEDGGKDERDPDAGAEARGRDEDERVPADQGAALRLPTGCVDPAQLAKEPQQDRGGDDLAVHGIPAERVREDGIRAPEHGAEAGGEGARSESPHDGVEEGDVDEVSEPGDPQVTCGFRPEHRMAQVEEQVADQEEVAAVESEEEARERVVHDPVQIQEVVFAEVVPRDGMVDDPGERDGDEREEVPADHRAALGGPLERGSSGKG